MADTKSETPLLSEDEVYLLRCAEYDHPLVLTGHRRLRVQRLMGLGLLEKNTDGEVYRSTDAGEAVLKEYRRLGWVP